MVEDKRHRRTDPNSASSSRAGGDPTPMRQDPLRGSRSSGAWIAVGLLTVLLVLLIIFIAQNTQDVEISFLGWNGQTPLAVGLMAAAVLGLLVATIVGSLRILQLRRRVRRDERT